jgi:hypothetical protein
MEKAQIIINYQKQLILEIETTSWKELIQGGTKKIYQAAVACLTPSIKK